MLVGWLILAAQKAHLPTDAQRLQAVIERPTGKNGYEDYIQAALCLADKPAWKLVDYALDLKAKQEGRNVTLPARPPEISAGAPPERVYTIAVRACQPAFAWIRRGNSKLVTNPRPRVTSATLFVEPIYFSRLVRMLALESRLAFTRGDSDSGSNALLDGLRFVDKFPVGSVVTFLVGARGERELFREVAKNLGSLTTSDAAQIRAWANNSLACPSPLIAVAEIERRTYWEDWIDWYKRPDEPLSVMNLTKKRRADIRRVWMELSASQKNRMYNEYVRGREAVWGSLAKELRGPESGWMTKLKEDDPDRNRLLEYAAPEDRARLFEVLGYLAQDVPLPPGLNIRKVRSLLRPKDLAAYREIVPGENLAAVAFVFSALMLFNLLEDSLVPMQDLQKLAVKSRIQRRLLVLSLDVENYQRQRGRLPNGLAEVEGGAPLDPFTGDPYRYVLAPDGKFRLSSPTKSIGEISLDGQDSRRTIAFHYVSPMTQGWGPIFAGEAQMTVPNGLESVLKIDPEIMRGRL